MISETVFSPVPMLDRIFSRLESPMSFRNFSTVSGFIRRICSPLYEPQLILSIDSDVVNTEPAVTEPAVRSCEKFDECVARLASNPITRNGEPEISHSARFYEKREPGDNPDSL
jgi:hypothetical protein